MKNNIKPGAKRLLTWVLTAAMLLSCAAFCPVSAEEYSFSTGIEYKDSLATVTNPGRGYSPALRYTVAASGTLTRDVNGTLTTFSKSDLEGYGMASPMFELSAFSAGNSYVSDEAYTAVADSPELVGGQDIALTDEALAGIGAVFAAARELGVKLSPRFTYTNAKVVGAEPSELAVIEEHISDIAALINEYADTVISVEAGMIGPWGEMHSSLYTDDRSCASLMSTWRSSLDGSIPLLVRQPRWLMAYLGLDSAASLLTYDMTGVNIGFYNDGYLGSGEDCYTWSMPGAVSTDTVSRADAITLLDSMLLPYGGEYASVTGTQELQTENDYRTASPIFDESFVHELYSTHLTYLHNLSSVSNLTNTLKEITLTEAGSYYAHANVKEYVGSSLFKFIEDHAGYRFVLREDSTALAADGTGVCVDFTVENTGFAPIFHDTKASIIIADELGNTEELAVDIDPAGWVSGSAVSEQIAFTLPYYARGRYDVYLRITDAGGAGAVRFANAGIYNESYGANLIGTFTAYGNDSDNTDFALAGGATSPFTVTGGEAVNVGAARTAIYKTYTELSAPATDLTFHLSVKGVSEPVYLVGAYVGFTTENASSTGYGTAELPFLSHGTGSYNPQNQAFLITEDGEYTMHIDTATAWLAWNYEDACGGITAVTEFGISAIDAAAYDADGSKQATDVTVSLQAVIEGKSDYERSVLWYDDTAALSSVSPASYEAISPIGIAFSSYNGQPLKGVDVRKVLTPIIPASTGRDFICWADAESGESALSLTGNILCAYTQPGKASYTLDLPAQLAAGASYEASIKAVSDHAVTGGSVLITYDPELITVSGDTDADGEYTLEYGEVQDGTVGSVSITAASLTAANTSLTLSGTALADAQALTVSESVHSAVIYTTGATAALNKNDDQTLPAEQTVSIGEVLLDDADGFTLVYKAEGIDTPAVLNNFGIGYKTYKSDGTTISNRNNSATWDANWQNGEHYKLTLAEDGSYYMYVNRMALANMPIYSVYQLKLFSAADNAQIGAAAAERTNTNEAATLSVLGVFRDNLSVNVTFCDASGAIIARTDYAYTDMSGSAASAAEGLVSGKLASADDIFAVTGATVDAPTGYKLSHWADADGNEADAIYTDTVLYPVFTEDENAPKVIADADAAITATEAGGTVSVPVLLSGASLAGATLKAEADSSLTLTGVDTEGTLMAGGTAQCADYAVLATADGSEVTDGVLVKLIFTALSELAEGDEVSITVTLTDAVNAAGEELADTVVSGAAVTYTVQAAPAEDEVLWGDVDGSGEITPLDAMYLSRRTNEWDPSTYAEAINIEITGDVDGNGEITPLDAMYLSRRANEWDPSTYAEAVNLK